jgi:hypothetical protein
MKQWGMLAAATLGLLTGGCSKTESRDEKRSDESSKTEWQVVSSPEGRFRIEMPGSPGKTTSHVGAIVTTTFELKANLVTHVIAYGDSPPGAVYDYDEGIRAIAGQYDGTVTTKRDFTLNGKTGKEFEISFSKPQNGHCAGRLLFTGTRLYQVVAVGPWVRLSDDYVQRYLDSFELTKE